MSADCRNRALSGSRRRFAPHGRSGPVLARCAPVLTARGDARASPKRALSRGTVGGSRLVRAQAKNTALAAFALDLPAPVMADLLGMRINTAVTWGQTIKRDWYSFAA